VIVQSRRERPTATPSDGVHDGMTEAIRPAAVLPVTATRRILMALADEDVRRGGLWSAVPGAWRRFDRPWAPDLDLDPKRRTRPVVVPVLLGTIRCVYDQPSRHMTTLFRVDVTPAGLEAGWTLDTLCNEALAFAGLDTDTCDRAELAPPPPSFNTALRRRYG
jgi:hypothetical protein